MLPVKEHNEPPSKQFQLGCFAQKPPCSRLLEAEPPLRNIKKSFLDYFDDIEQYANQTSDTTNFRHALTAIHSGDINAFTDSLSLNGILGVKAPPIAGEQIELTRESRVTLAHFSFGYCATLNYHLSRIDP